MPSNAKGPQGHLVDKVRSLFSQRGPGKKKDGLPPKAHFSIWYFLVAFLLVMFLQQYFSSSKVETISYGEFKQKVAEGAVGKLTIGPENITGTLKEKENNPDRQFTTVRVDDPGLVKELDDRKVDYSGRHDSKLLGTILTWVLPLAIMVLIWRFAMKRMGPGQGVMSFAKSKAKLFAESETKVTFADVAGIDEAKEELREVVEFLVYESHLRSYSTLPGIMDNARVYYWKLLFWSLFRRPRLLPMAMAYHMYGFHFRKAFAENR